MADTDRSVSNDHNPIRTHDQDSFEFKRYSAPLARQLLRAKAPYTLGVFGPWGSGKTGMMRLIECDVVAEGKARGETVLPVWFDAWKYDRDESIWRALLINTFGVLDEALAKQEKKAQPSDPSDELKEARKLLTNLESSLYRTVTVTTPGSLQLDGLKLLKGGAKVALNAAVPGIHLLGKLFSDKAEADTEAEESEGWDGKGLDELLGALHREEKKHYFEQVRFLDQFQGNFERAIAACKAAEVLDKLVVFIDDLDRCLPEKAVEVMEAVKLFLGNDYSLFVVGVDEAVIHRGIAHRYGEMFAQSNAGEDSERAECQRLFREEYLEKIVQLPFHMPPVVRQKLDDYLGAQLALENDEHRQQVLRVFELGVERNPRKLLRACGVFNLLWELGGAGGEGCRVYPDVLAKLVAIQLRDSELARAMVAQSALLSALQRYFEQFKQYENANGARAHLRRDDETEVGDSEAIAPQPNRFVQPFAKRYWLEGLLLDPISGKALFSELSGAEIRAHFELAVAEEISPQPKPESITVYPANVVLGTRASSPELHVSPINRDILERLLSEELTEIESAANELDESDYPAYSTELYKIFTADDTPWRRRISAGDAMGFVGDPRYLEDGEAPWLRPDYWVNIPEGEFWRGSDERDNEKPAGAISLSAYAIAACPVTNAEYARYVQAVGSAEPPEHWRGQSKSPRGQANHPVVNVNWHEARGFVEWVTSQPSVPGRIALPSEAQWERAARGPLDIDGAQNKRRWPWGDDDGDIHQRCNVGRELGRTSAVGSYTRGASLEGALDMAGNVFEWCADGYDSAFYGRSPKRDPLNGEEVEARVLRGGSWFNFPGLARAASRLRYGPDFRDWGRGFRVWCSSPISFSDH